MPESLGHWFLLPWWELRAGNSYMHYSFSGLLRLTKEASGSLKMYDF